MGSSRILHRTPKTWQASIGAMMANGTEVMVTCSKCQFTVKPLPLEPIAAKYGLEFSLWDRRPKCRRPGCSSTMIFMASPGDGTPYTPMLS